MANKPTFEDFFSLKEPIQVLEEVQTTPTKELNGVHKETSQAQTAVWQMHENGKEDAIQRLQNAIEELAAKIQPQQQDFTPLLEAFRKIQVENQPAFQEELLTTLKTLQLFQAKVEQKLDLLTRQQTKKQPEPTQNEALEKLQTHSLYLAKIEQKLEILNRMQQKNQVPSTQNEALEKLQTHSLYLAKIEQKLEVLNRTQQAQAKQPKDKEDTNEKWQTHSLYLAKMEQKLELIQRHLQKMQLPQNKEVDNEKWQTNNLYLAKIDQKLELLSRIQQKLQATHQTPDTNETAEKLQTNNLFLAKIEQKLELISRTQQKSNLPTQDHAKQDFTQIEAQLQALTASMQNQQPTEEPQAHQALLEKLQGYQNTLSTIEENIQSMQENVLQLQHNQTKIAQPQLESILPAPEFWDKLHLIMERNETQIKEIRQVIEAVAQSAPQQEQPNSTDAILSGLHTNNVYLAKMEQRLETLNKALEKVVQKKT